MAGSVARGAHVIATVRLARSLGAAVAVTQAFVVAQARDSPALRSLAGNYPHRTCPDPRSADASQLQGAPQRPSRHVEQQSPKSVLPLVRHGRLLDHLN